MEPEAFVLIITFSKHKKGDDHYEEFDILEGSTILKLQSAEMQNWKLTKESKKVKDLTLHNHYVWRKKLDRLVYQRNPHLISFMVCRD